MVLEREQILSRKTKKGGGADNCEGPLKREEQTIEEQSMAAEEEFLGKEWPAIRKTPGNAKGGILIKKELVTDWRCNTDCGCADTGIQEEHWVVVTGVFVVLQISALAYDPTFGLIINNT